MHGGRHRTSGDEVQGVLDDPAVVVELTLWLARDGGWSTGIGAGPVRAPLPASTRAGAGAAFEHARTAVQRAKRDPQHLAVDATGDASEVEGVLRLLAALAQRRTDLGWEAIDAVARTGTQQAAADELGITKQAVSQRLHAALWPQELAVRPLAMRLLAEVDG